MQRARRLVSVAVVAVLGVLVVGGCSRSNPDVAAYIGGTRIPTSRVDDIYNDVRSKLAEQPQLGQPPAAPAQPGQPAQPTAKPSATPAVQMPITRRDVVNLLVSLDLAKRVADEKKLPVQDRAKAEQLTEMLRVPATTQYAQLWDEYVDVLLELYQNAKPQAISQDAVTQVYQEFQRRQYLQPGANEADVKQRIGTDPQIQVAVAVRDQLAERVKATHTTPNPRYLPLSTPLLLLQQSSSVLLYDLPMVTENVVTDQVTGAATAAP